MIRDDQAANIADLVNSSTELFFRSGTLRYALSASFNAPWDATPRSRSTWSSATPACRAFFRLTIGERRAGVEIIDILFDERGLDEAPRPNACPPRSRARASRSRPARGKPRARPRARIDPVSVQEWRSIVPDLPLPGRLPEDAMAVGAPNGDRGQRRQRQHARLSRARHAAVFRGARLLPDRTGRRPTRPTCPRLNRRRARCARSRSIRRNDAVRQYGQSRTADDHARRRQSRLHDGANIRRAFHQLILSALK